MFSAVIDNVVIHDNYYEDLLNGGLEGIQCVFGSNNGEYDQQYWKDGVALSAEEALEFTIEQNWGKLSDRGWNSANAQTVIDEYYSHNEAYGRDDYTAAKDLKNDLYLRVGSLMYAEAASQYTDVYMYYNCFDITPEGTALDDQMRTAHGSEIKVISRDWESLQTLFEAVPDAEETADMLSDIWAAFIQTGNPNCQALADKGVTWGTYHPNDKQTLVFSSQPEMVDGVRQEDVNTLMPLFREYGLLEAWKVSEPGSYTGWSTAEYDGYARYSVYVPVTDGTKLAVDYYIPTKDGVEERAPLPVVFTYTPYGRRRDDNVTSAEWFTQYGYGITTGVESTSTEDLDAKGLTFTTQPMEADFEITGHPMAYLSFEMLTEDEDIDFFVTLSDVDPETGEAFLFSDGHLRASLRGTGEAPYDFLGLPWHPADQEDAQPVTAGEIYELAIDLMPTSYIIPKGHSLRVTISNSMDRFYYLGRSEYEANPNCEVPSIRLYTGGNHASYLELPNIYE